MCQLFKISIQERHLTATRGLFHLTPLLKDMKLFALYKSVSTRSVTKSLLSSFLQTKVQLT